MLDTIRRIKWRNIAGLTALILVVFFLVYLVSFITTLLYGDCVEKENIKVCFSVGKQSLERYGATVITAEITNTGRTVSGAVVNMRLSPNLDNLSSTTQEVETMAPGDTVKREFRIAAKGERGRFRVEFDTNSDNKPDKEMFITVD